MTRANVPHAQVGTPATQDKPPPDPAYERRLLALGLSVGRVVPRDSVLESRATITPLIRYGSGTGIKPSIGFGWFNTNLRASTDADIVLGRVYFKPVMAGVGYTRQHGRLSGSVSLVGGVSFNRLSRRDTMDLEHEALDIDHSVAWRPSVSMWFDHNSRIAFNVSVNYLITRPRLTVNEGGETIERTLRADAVIIRAGVAYKIY